MRIRCPAAACGGKLPPANAALRDRLTHYSVIKVRLGEDAGTMLARGPLAQCVPGPTEKRRGTNTWCARKSSKPSRSLSWRAADGIGSRLCEVPRVGMLDSTENFLRVPVGTTASRIHSALIIQNKCSVVKGRLCAWRAWASRRYRVWRNSVVARAQSEGAAPLRSATPCACRAWRGGLRWDAPLRRDLQLLDRPNMRADLGEGKEMGPKNGPFVKQRGAIGGQASA